MEAVPRICADLMPRGSPGGSGLRQLDGVRVEHDAAHAMGFGALVDGSPVHPHVAAVHLPKRQVAQRGFDVAARLGLMVLTGVRLDLMTLSHASRAVARVTLVLRIKIRSACLWSRVESAK
jgi:hypothetical protein